VVVADCWLQRLLVWTPGQTDLIKTVALLLMVADHISMLCGLDNDWLRLAGRGAFPLFGLVWAMNLARHPQIQQRALNRLWIWAGVAQGGWILARLRPDLGNILFAFAVSGQALAMMQRHGPRTWPLSLMLVLAWLPFSAEARAGGGSDADAGLRRMYDGPAHHAHGAGAVSGTGDTRAECRGQPRLCHRGSGNTRRYPDGAEPDLLPRAEVLAARIFPAVLRGAPCRHRTDGDVISAVSE
jgi:hypothetical protein